MKRLALFAGLWIAAAQQGQAVIVFSLRLHSASNANMTAAEYADSKAYVMERARFRDPVYFGATTWWTNGWTTNWDVGENPKSLNIFFNRLTNYYQPPNLEIITTNAGLDYHRTNLWTYYGNELRVEFETPDAGLNIAWHLTAWPAEYTNSSFFIEHPAGRFTNSQVLAPIPTGTYSLAVDTTIRGYHTPAAQTVAVDGSAFDWGLTNTFRAYSNAIVVTVSGYPAGNCAWTVSGPAEYTNAVGYSLGQTNDTTLVNVPTGTYTFGWPGVVGWITPTNTATVDGSAPSVDVAAVYVLAYPTNVTPGGGIQRFYQPAYFLTNLFLHDSGVPLHERLGGTNTVAGVLTVAALVDLSNTVGTALQPVDLVTLSNDVAAAFTSVTLAAASGTGTVTWTEKQLVLTYPEAGGAGVDTNASYTFAVGTTQSVDALKFTNGYNSVTFGNTNLGKAALLSVEALGPDAGNAIIPAQFTIGRNTIDFMRFYYGSALKLVINPSGGLTWGDTAVTLLESKTGADFTLQTRGGTDSAGKLVISKQYAQNPTSGDTKVLEIGNTFSPASGAASNKVVVIAPTINQTGTASGDTFGLFIGPTLTTILGKWWPLYITEGTSSIPDLVIRGSLTLGTNAPVTNWPTPAPTEPTNWSQYAAQTPIQMQHVAYVNSGVYTGASSANTDYAPGGQSWMQNWTDTANAMTADGSAAVCAYSNDEGTKLLRIYGLQGLTIPSDAVVTQALIQWVGQASASAANGAYASVWTNAPATDSGPAGETTFPIQFDDSGWQTQSVGVACNFTMDAGVAEFGIGIESKQQTTGESLYCDALQLLRLQGYIAGGTNTWSMGIGQINGSNGFFWAAGDNRYWIMLP